MAGSKQSVCKNTGSYLTGEKILINGRNNQTSESQGQIACFDPIDELFQSGVSLVMLLIDSLLMYCLSLRFNII